jgi:hypothetical protein
MNEWRVEPNFSSLVNFGEKNWGRLKKVTKDKNKIFWSLIWANYGDN